MSNKRQKIDNQIETGEHMITVERKTVNIPEVISLPCDDAIILENKINALLDDNHISDLLRIALTLEKKLISANHKGRNIYRNHYEEKYECSVCHRES